MPGPRPVSLSTSEKPCSGYWLKGVQPVIEVSFCRWRAAL